MHDEWKWNRVNENCYTINGSKVVCWLYRFDDSPLWIADISNGVRFCTATNIIEHAQIRVYDKMQKDGMLEFCKDFPTRLEEINRNFQLAMEERG